MDLAKRARQYATAIAYAGLQVFLGLCLLASMAICLGVLSAGIDFLVVGELARICLTGASIVLVIELHAEVPMWLVSRYRGHDTGVLHG